MVLTVFLASVIIYWATEVLPGDVATMYLGRYATHASQEPTSTPARPRQAHPVQYARWVGNYVNGRLGQLREHGRTGAAGGLRATRQLPHARPGGLCTLRPLGILLGLIAAVRRNSWVGQYDLNSLAGVHRPARVRQRRHPDLDLRRPAPLAAGESAIDPGSSLCRRFPTSSCRPSPWHSPVLPT